MLFGGCLQDRFRDIAPFQQCRIAHASPLGLGRNAVEELLYLALNALHDEFGGRHNVWHGIGHWAGQYTQDPEFSSSTDGPRNSIAHSGIRPWTTPGGHKHPFVHAAPLLAAASYSTVE